MAINQDIEVLPAGAALAATATSTIDNLNCSRGKLLINVTAADAGARFTPIVHVVDRTGGQSEIQRGRPMYGPGQYDLNIRDLPRRFAIEFHQNNGSKSMTMNATLSMAA